MAGAKGRRWENPGLGIRAIRSLSLSLLFSSAVQKLRHQLGAIKRAQRTLQPQPIEPAHYARDISLMARHARSLRVLRVISAPSVFQLHFFTLVAASPR